MFTQTQYQTAATELGCEAEMIEAVCEKEITGKEFFFTASGGRKIPKILFERHVFWDLLAANNVNPQQIINADRSYADILAQTPSPQYGKYIQQYARRDRAIAIDRDAAFGACSYSSFQIMGYHHVSCGYDSAEAFAEAMADPDNHLPAFVAFIKSEGLDKLLAARDFEGFARRYNGKDYWRKGYHIELARIYQRILARNLPRHESAIKAALQSGTIQRGAAIVTTAAAPVAPIAVNSDGISTLLQTVQDYAAKGQNTLDQVNAIHNQAAQLAPLLKWLPWAASGWTILLLALLYLLIRRYWRDRGYT